MGVKPPERSPDHDQLARPGRWTWGGSHGRDGRWEGSATSWPEARRPVDLVEKQLWNGRDGTGDQLARPVTDLARTVLQGPGTAGGPVQSEGPVGLARDGRRGERPVGHRPADLVKFTHWDGRS